MSFRQEILVVGIGGSGVVWTGTLLARAGSHRYPYVTRFPNFTTSMRGGPCECLVILSDQPIASSLFAQADVMMVLDNSQLLPFGNRLRPGGLLLAEQAGLPPQVDEMAARLVAVPTLELARSLGDLRVSNLVMVGAYAELTGTIPAELVEKELEARFGVAETGIAASAEKKSLSLFQLNLDGFRRGQDWARAYLAGQRA